MTAKTMDPRVERTLAALDRAFRDLALEKGIGAITVRSLCERARVNKNTFYRYYGALEDLIAEVMSSYSQEWRRRARSVDSVDNVVANARDFILFSATQDDLYEAITCDPAWSVIQRQLQHDASGDRAAAIPEGFTAEQWTLFYAFTSQSVLAMYRAWVSAGKASDAHAIADLTAETVEAGATVLMNRIRAEPPH